MSRTLTSVFLFSIILFQSCVKVSKKTLVIGHRGAMGHVMENTVASIVKAMEMDVDMVEIDVFTLKSGEVVVFHDDKVDRLTNGTGKIENYTWEELQKITLNGGYKIPLLTEVLDAIQHKIKLNIELKGANTAIKVNSIINRYIAEEGWQLDDFIISSFNWNELELMRETNQDIKIGVLTGSNPLNALETATKLKAVAINPGFSNLTAENAKIIKEAGFKIYTWTVNDPADINRMIDLQVDGIFTNFPERVK